MCAPVRERERGSEENDYKDERNGVDRLFGRLKIYRSCPQSPADDGLSPRRVEVKVRLHVQHGARHDADVVAQQEAAQRCEQRQHEDKHRGLGGRDWNTDHTGGR